MKFFTNFNDSVKIAMKERGWKQTDDMENADFLWLSVETFRLYVMENATNVLADSNRYFNHVKNFSQLSRKDIMAQHIRAFRNFCAKLCPSLLPSLQFIPDTFDPRLGIQQITSYYQAQRQKCKFIVKPAGMGRGDGIFVCSYEELVIWYNQVYLVKHAQSDSYQDKFVVQKYVSDLLLISGHKFDCRIYVYVQLTTPSTMRVWTCSEGFGRFALEKFDAKSKDAVQHLTNVAVQKHNENYDQANDGAKWSLEMISEHLMLRFGEERVRKMFRETELVIVRSLQATAQHFDYARNCSEVFGYDVMFGADLSPILIEVNTSPSLDADTDYDLFIKRRMIHDMLSIQGADCKLPLQLPVGASCADLVRLFSEGAEGSVGKSKQQKLKQKRKMQQRIDFDGQLERKVFGCWHLLYDGPIIREQQLQGQKEIVVAMILDCGIVKSEVQLGEGGRVEYLV